MYLITSILFRKSCIFHLRFMLLLFHRNVTRQGSLKIKINLIFIARKTSGRSALLTMQNFRSRIKSRRLVLSTLVFKIRLPMSKTRYPENIGILYKLRHYLSIHVTVLKQLYYTLIYPYLNYAVVVWGNTYLLNLNELCNLFKINGFIVWSFC